MATANKIELARVDELKPYENNARQHSEKQIEQIAASIRAFGFITPVLIDEANNVIAGHGRIMAAKRIGLERVPAVRVEGMTETERRAYIIADNRLTELGGWSWDIVADELEAINLGGFDVSLTGFDVTPKSGEEWFEDHETGEATEEDTEEYQAFLDKFEPKRTTDDCYTPPKVYDAVADWVASEYGLDHATFVRPFYPGGDYQRDAESYKGGEVVVDNPPFSILAEIVKFYVSKGIRFFLFAPALTMFSGTPPEVCNIAAGARVTFENGAVVRVGFKTNMEPGTAVRTAPTLTAAIDKADTESRDPKTVLKYEYPASIIVSAVVCNWGEAGIEFRVPHKEARAIRVLDAQKAAGISGIYGAGFILSDKQAAHAAQAARAARLLAERKNERAKELARAHGIPEDQITEEGAVVWQLSPREREIVDELNRAGAET